MKLKLLFSFAIVMLFSGCSTKDDLFDKGRRCSLQSNDVKDAFGEVIKKSNNNDECPEIDLNPCVPQFKNRELLGEVTDDTKNSVVICPEVKESPVLPSDYTEDISGEIDITESLENEDINSTEGADAQKSVQEDEDLGILASGSVESEKNSADKLEVNSKNDGKKKTSTAKVKNKKKFTPKQKPIYKMSLGPFYKGKVYVPYSVKLSFEKNLSNLRSKYKKNRKFHYKFIAYFSTGKNGEDKKIAAKRAKELVDYATWRKKIDMSSFQLVLKPTSTRAKAQKVDILVFIR